MIRPWLRALRDWFLGATKVPFEIRREKKRRGLRAANNWSKP